MGFFETAREAAAAEYGKARAEEYGRRERAKRTTGWVAVATGAGFLLSYTYGAAVWTAIRTYVMYGLGALLVFAGFLVLAYIGRRSYKSRTRGRTFRRDSYDW